MTDMRDILVGGYKKFRALEFQDQKSLYESLGTEGQDPDVMILSCADSRVDPTDIFHAYPGEMFVVRNVANMMPPLQKREGYHGTASAIEYGVKALNVKAIVVLGHESCGGAAGCLHGIGDAQFDYVGSWVELLEPAKQVVLAAEPDNADRLMEHETVKLSISNLMTYPFIRERVEAGELDLIGMWFSIISAKLMMLEKGEWREVPTD